MKIANSAATADEVARRIKTHRVAPSCAAGCASKQGATWQKEVGGDLGLFFDLASLTKPMTAVAVAVAGSVASLDRRVPLGAVLAEASDTPSERVPLELFLAHRAGLEGHRPLYAPLLRGERVDVSAAYRDAACARRADAQGDAPADGFPSHYSDLGYILAGAALARHVGAFDAGEAIARLVLEPLGLTRAVGTVRDLRSAGIVGPFSPTEDVPWRGGRIVGAVHDENAWALTGAGGSGHAGLFGTVGGVLAFACTLLDSLEVADSRRPARWTPDHEVLESQNVGSPSKGSPLLGTDLAWLLRPRPDTSLRAGFDGKSERHSSAGTKMSPQSFGHLGFVGTSLWIDPEAKVVVTLLTNRVFCGRSHLAIREARPWAHDTLWTRGREISQGYP